MYWNYVHKYASLETKLEPTKGGVGKNEVLKRKYGFLNPMIRTGSLVVGLKGVRCGEGGSCWDLFELNFLQT